MNRRTEFNQVYFDHIQKREIVLCPDARERIGAFFCLLSEENQRFNLTGYKNVGDFVDYHLLDTMTLLRNLEIPTRAIVTDVGSGAGVPGLLLKLLRPDLNLILIESIKKKASFLEKAAREFHLSDCVVLCDRAENLAHQIPYREKSDLVTARALASLSVTLELTAGFVRLGKELALFLGSEDALSAQNEKVAETLGCCRQKNIPYTLPNREQRFYIAVFHKISLTPELYPRKPGQIKKRPL